MPAARPAEPDAYRAPALEKGLDVLELLAAQEGSRSLSQIAAALGRSVQEVYRVVLALERRGYVERGPDDGLRLSLRLFDLACAHPPLRRLRDDAGPVLTPLAAGLQQVVTLAVPEGSAFRVVAVGRNPAAVGFAVRLGATRPLMEGASGRVLLAFGAEAVAVRGAAARLAAIAARGGEVAQGETLQGITDVSFPVVGADGRAQAALTMPYLAGAAAPVALPDAARRVHGAAATLSQALGGAQPPAPLLETLA